MSDRIENESQGSLNHSDPHLENSESNQSDEFIDEEMLKNALSELKETILQEIQEKS